MSPAEVYDPVELRRRIVVAFTPGELRELAEQLGVGGSIPWERGVQEAARELVRQCERYAGLPALVARLREVRPLVEWPEPAAPAASDAFVATSMAMSAAAATGTAATAVGLGPLQPAIADPYAAPPAEPAPAVVAPTMLSGVAAPPATGPAPFAPAVFPTGGAPLAAATGQTVPGLATPGQAAPLPAAPAPAFLFGTPPPPGSFAATPSAAPAPSAPAAAAPPPARAPAPPSAPAPQWPGMVVVPPPGERGIDPRILVAVAGLMLLAAVVAYLAGRASSGGSASTTATAPSAAAEARRADGPAALAADTLARSLDNLARVCEQKPAALGDGELVFRRVYDRCGPVPPSPRPYSPPLPSATTSPGSTASPDDAPRDTPRNKLRRPADPAPGPAPQRGCVAACDADHRACKAGCGPEPTESGGYQGYQSCLGRCLANNSACRRGCP